MTNPADEYDVSRLPRHGQVYVKSLLAKIERLEGRIAELTVGPEDSDTFAEPYAEEPLPLGRRAHVRFNGATTTEGSFDVQMKDGDLHILVNGTMDDAAIMPQSNNVIRIRRIPRKRVARLQLFLLFLTCQHDTTDERDETMTEQNEAPAGTALAQVAPGALARVASGKPFTVADLADLIAGPAEKPKEETSFPAVPAQVKITDAVRKALAALPKVFGQVAPTERRKLEKDELSRLTVEAGTLAAIAKQLGERAKNIQEYVRTHQDFVAEELGIADERIAEGVAAGHFLIATPGDPFVTPVEGFEDGWQQRYVKGRAVQELDLLEELLMAEKITREEYLGFTRTVRTLDDDKIKSFIKKSPKRGLEILAAITRRSAPTASLYAPKKKQ